MANSVRLTVSKQIPTNITSSLSMSADHTHFATLTRQLSTLSSQWIYRLDYYNAHTFELLQIIDIYSTYDINKHFLTFVPTAHTKNLIAVATVTNVIFYETSPLKQVKRVLHRQANVYDLTASPNGQLVVLVGQTIMIYRTVGFKEVIFPQIVQNARHCDFSADGFYMAIASTSSINLYTFQRTNDNYQFQQVPLTNFQAPVDNGAITSVQFNPSNSSELLIGYLSSSPGVYSIQNGGTFFKKLNDIQPMSAQNAKVARYLPDNSRFFSYDFINGVGLWPGPGGKLFYKQNFLLYGISPNVLGTRIVGFVWQQIKVVDIMLTCPGGTEAGTCPCPNGQAWDYANYKCQPLSCLQAEYATGQVQGNACVCISQFVWNPVKRKCAINCGIIDKALPSQPDLYQCYCGDNWSWNSFTRTCEFDCTRIPYSSGIRVSPNINQCACLPGFRWNSTLLQCQCPPYMAPAGSVCLCFNSYTLDAKGVCIPDCALIPNAVGPGTNPQQCTCSPRYYFATRGQQAGCQLNCSAINDTVQQFDFNNCICRQHMDWLNNTICVVNCKLIDYSDAIALSNNTCACAINYHWRDSIKQCARNCEGVSYIDPMGSPTLRACPCIQNFLWSESKTRCEIQCGQIANSEQYSLTQYNKCQCRPGFLWNDTTYDCKVDCKSIWNAVDRINNTHCSCKDDQAFDRQKLTCASASTAGIFSSSLSIAGLVVAVVVALVIMIILVRFCWSFKTEKNEQHDKKIKGKSSKKKKGKMAHNRKAPAMMEDELRTNQRLTSPRKSKS